jgi:hypothetical protein
MSDLDPILSAALSLSEDERAALAETLRHHLVDEEHVSLDDQAQERLAAFAHGEMELASVER